ncbi:hypothetical protein SELMODRAFT_406481 [Selaginella moellendorffii]|uniref:Uncharacterized protein n=1 Tax=Selaginella moellendorffii TaxID=88036 RepID=D8R2H9_SELML|nr:hypothetical protein SELMODRAFT_406481 [Selaginella moellendorffii]
MSPVSTKRFRPTMLTDIISRKSYNNHLRQILQANRNFQTSHKYEADKRENFLLKSPTALYSGAETALASTAKDNVDKDLELEASGFRKCFPGQNWNQQQQQQQPSRTCTKVHKHGAVGRALDLSKFQGYTQLLEDLQHLFGTDENLNVRVASRIFWGQESEAACNDMINDKRKARGDRDFVLKLSRLKTPEIISTLSYVVAGLNARPASWETTFGTCNLQNFNPAEGNLNEINDHENSEGKGMCIA